MKLSEVQPYVTRMLRTAAAFAAAGVPVIEDDGNYPKIAGREEALTFRETDPADVKKGLCLTVWQIESDGRVAHSKGGLLSHQVRIHVIIEEVVAINRGKNGFGMLAEEAVEEVQKALLGKPGATPPYEPIEPHDPPFDNFGVVNGVRRMVVNFSTVINVRGA